MQDSGDTLLGGEFLTQDALWQLIQMALLETLAELGLLDSGLFLLPDAYATSDTAVMPTALRDSDFPAERRPSDPADDEAWRDFYTDVVYAFLRERQGAGDGAPAEIRRAADAAIARELAGIIAYYERVRARENALRARRQRQQDTVLNFTSPSAGTPPDAGAAEAAASPETNADTGRSGYVGQTWSEGGIGVDSTWWSLLGDPWPGQGN